MKKSIAIICLLTLVACGTKKSDTPENVSTTVGNQNTKDTLLAVDSVKTPERRPTYRAAETILTDLIHTKLEVNFNWTNSRMNGIATITAKPHFYASDSLILDAKGMDILSVQLDKKDLSFSYLDSLTLKIKLNKTYSRKEKYTVVINYVAKPDERKTGGSSAITSDKGLYFINPKGEDPNKMPQIWTQGLPQRFDLKGKEVEPEQGTASILRRLETMVRGQ
jgi:aminopeptidase N